MTTAVRDEGVYKPLPQIPAAYKLTDEESGAVYIGSTGNLRGRIAQHKSRVSRGNHPNVDFRNRVKSWDSVSIEFIPCTDLGRARKVEDSLLTFNSDNENLINIAVGQEQEPLREGRVFRNDHYDKINPLGKTDEVREALSEKLKGQKRDTATRERMSESAKRRGKNFSEEGIAKGRAIRSTPVIVDGVLYDSSRAAGRAFGLCEHTAKKRASSDKYDNWSFGPKEN